MRRKNLLVLLVSLVFLTILIPSVCANDNETVLLSDGSLDMAPISISGNGGDILNVSDDYYSVENDDAYNKNALAVSEDEVSSDSAKEESNATVIVPSDAKAGESAIISVEIPNATGNVSVLVDGKETIADFVNGKAVVGLENLTAGDHSVVVIYYGDETHDSTHTISSFHVSEKIVVKRAVSEFVDVVVFDDCNVSAALVDEEGKGIIDAKINYAIGGRSGSVVTDSNGIFKIKGENGLLMTVTYEGDSKYLPANTTIQFENNVPAVIESTSILSEDFTQYACDFYEGERGGHFTFRLVDSKGKPIAKKTIFIGYNGVTLNRTTDANGYASVQINLKNAGLYTFVIVFLGDDDYDASMAVHKVTINKKPVTISASAKTFKAKAKTKKYTVTFKTIQGSSADGKTYFASGKKVTLDVAGKTYSAKIADNGKATFNLKLTKKGKYTAKVNFAEDVTYKSASKSVKITIK